MSENVRTYLRIKPQTIPDDVSITGDTVRIDNNEFGFDKIFRNSTQQEVFQEISRNLLVECMQGYNCTLFAYGQTGSGKTYTVQGSGQNTGIVQKSLKFLHGNADFEISLSFVEIYNETMLDLFDTDATLSIREDSSCGVVVDNLRMIESSSYEESIELYLRGIKTRKTSSTCMNKESSRSHSIFTVYLKSNGIMSKSSRLCFVDLAGSERLGEGEIEEMKMKEAVNINKSLLCLGKVINKLSNDEDGHIGYRESKLTFLLKDSLGGNCKLTVIGNVSLEHRNDSLNTMNFLLRSRMIRNLAVVNSSVGGELEEVRTKLKMLDSENQCLKAQLALMNTRFEEETMILPSYYCDIKRVMRSVEDIIDTFIGVEEMMREISTFDFDENRRILLNIHDSFVSSFQEGRMNGHSSEGRMKRKRMEE